MTKVSRSFVALHVACVITIFATAYCPLANAQSDPPADIKAADVADAIRKLGSAEFSVRQVASEELESAGSSAVSALERAARSGEVETATRCVEVLARIARDKGNTETALAALERLAGDSSNRIADLAARTLTELRMTDEDRAIAALEADGARLSRGRDGEIFSARVSRDHQVVLLKHLPQLRTVRMRGQGITDVGISNLADVKLLASLTISSTAVSDVGLHKLKSLKSLDRLSLSGPFTSDGLRQLRHVASLRTLSFHFSTDEMDLSFLAELPQVNSLYISEVRVDRDRVRKINQLDHVRRLHLTVTGADDEDLRWLGKVEVPLHLSVMRSVKATDAGFKSLAGARLLGLSLVRTPVTDERLEHVGRMSLLESLTIMDAPISDAGLEYLKGLKALRTLTLRNTRATEEGVASLQRFLPNLIRPRIVVNAAARPIRRRNRIGFTENPETGGKNAHFMARPTAEDIERLKQMPNLDTVFLGRETKDEDLLTLARVATKGIVVDSMQVTDRGVQALADHSTLESLGLWSSSITDKSLKSAAQIRSLTKLAIHKAEITDEGVRGLIVRLAQSGKLKTLHLFRCPKITDAGLRQIDQLTSLEQLFLNNNSGLTSGILKQVARLRNLRRLEIDSIELNEADLAHLTELTKLQTLGMSCSDSSSKLTDRGLSSLTGMTSLQSLTIQRAKVTDRGVASLVQLPALQRLGLAYTEVGNLGVAALANGLPNLLRLSLAGTNITDSGMTHVGRLTQLEWLWLNETEVGDEGIRQLDRLKKLQHLYVDAAGLSNEAHQHFQRAHPATQIHLQ